MHDLLNDGTVSLIAAFAPLALWDSVWPYLVMLIGFSIIIFVHELGHFAVAKWCDVRVEKFAIGFGRELFGFSMGETRYSFNILPLGGYVKMLGQEDFDDKAKELQFKNDPRSFVNKRVSRRMAIVSAGVIMNTLFACLLFMVVFLHGKEAIGTRIAYIEADSPAERAGLRPGDVIRKINGETILEFNEVRMAVMLAPPHELLEFVVERDTESKTIAVQPETVIPESTRGVKRQIVGIAPGVTREIVGVGPQIDILRPDHVHVGDKLVEIDGVEVTDDNVNEVINMLAYAKGDVYIERTDPEHADAPPERIRVEIPPILTIYPTISDGDPAVNVLGLVPLLRFDYVHPKGRASLVGIETGDAILSWDDVRYPDFALIARSIQDNAERDIHFVVKKADGRIKKGFVRPKRHSRGPATIQAVCRAIEDSTRPDQLKARFVGVKPGGTAARAGIESGDEVVSCAGKLHASMADVNHAIRAGAGREIPITIRKADGRTARVRVIPEAPGSIDARFNLIADDILRVGGVVKTIRDKPSPAAIAGIEPGIVMTHVNNKPLSKWRELIDVFRQYAGTTVKLGYVDAAEQARTADFPVPHSLRTLVGIGSESRIVSIDGRRTILVDSSRGREETAVGYRKGTVAILSELVGHKHVPVEYRENALADLQTAYIDVTEDMIDPWLGRIAFSPNIVTNSETVMLKGENALDAVWIGIHKTYYFILQVYKTMERMIFTRSLGMDNISGPLGIIDMGGKVARAGIVDFIFFMAIISANLAVINFLPLPIVDGGLMIFLIIEKIKGSPVSLRVQVATQMIGLFLIIGVFILVTFNDAMRLWG